MLRNRTSEPTTLYSVMCNVQHPGYQTYCVTDVLDKYLASNWPQRALQLPTVRELSWKHMYVLLHNGHTGLSHT